MTPVQGAAGTPVAPLASQHIPALDGIRGLAVLLVMVSHFAILSPTTSLHTFLVEAARVGWVGVDLFFVLSGFLITGILVDSRGSHGYFSRFYARRTLRIFPLYYAFVIAVIWVWPAVSGEGAVPWPHSLAFLTYTGNFLFASVGWEGLPGHTTHLWSLAIEEQFYLIWPLVVFLVAPQRLARACVAVIALAQVARLGLWFAYPDGIAGYALLPSRMDALAIGALLATLVRVPGWDTRLRRLAKPVLLTAGTMLALAAALSFALLPGQGAFPPLALHVQLLAYPAFDLLAAVLIGASALWFAHGRQTFLDGATLRNFGRYSYALYLIHVPLRNLVQNRVFPDGVLPPVAGSVLLTQALVLVGGIAVSYGLALLSWHVFEKHFLRLKERFAWQRPARAVTLPTAAVPPLRGAT